MQRVYSKVERFDGVRTEQSLARLEALARLMDSAFVIPGTNIRMGLDGLIGLVPIAGDLIAGLVSSYLIWEARQLGASRWVIGRMMANTAIDTLVGAVPLVGDAFDVLFRANLKNMALLRRHLERRGVTRARSRAGHRGRGGSVALNPPVCRRASPRTIAAATATLSERRPGLIGIRSRASASPTNRFRHPGALAAQQQRVVGAECEAGVGRLGVGGEQHEAGGARPAPPPRRPRSRRAARSRRGPGSRAPPAAGRGPSCRTRPGRSRPRPRPGRRPAAGSSRCSAGYRARRAQGACRQDSPIVPVKRGATGIARPRMRQIALGCARATALCPV